MTESLDAAARAARSRLELELGRAADAAARAAKQEALLAIAPESMQPLHARLARLHRRTEQRHLASAAVHRLYAQRMASRRLYLPGSSGAMAFLAGVAGMLDATSALVTLRSERAVVAVTASDEIARKAHDLELVMGEGPAREAATAGVPVLLAGNALCDRWPRFGPVVSELGVTAVIAAPLGLAATRFGAMCALGSQPTISDHAPVTLDGVARALTGMLLNGTAGGAHDDDDLLPPLGPIFRQDVVNQAVGMVSVQCACSIDDAADLIAARAFAEGLPVADVARQVVAGQLSLADL